MPVGVYERTDAHRAILRKHGECSGENQSRRTPEYRAWRHMMVRCYNQNSPDYSIYGGRGITVCQAWRVDFAAFLADMGRRPSAGHSLDRIDCHGNYEPTNCRWATHFEQVNNRRNSRRIEVDGELFTIKQLAERAGISYYNMHARLRRFPLERAINPNRVTR